MHVGFYISGHGLGHLAQCGPVIEALSARFPDLKLSLRTEISEHLLARRVQHPFSISANPVDCGFVMANALDIDVEGSKASYRAFHEDFAGRVSRDAKWLDDQGIELVITNISHLGAAAANAVGIPAVGLCSLNWADTYAHYFGRDAVWSEIRDAYACLDRFFCPAPSMIMPGITNRVDIGCIASLGRNRRQTLNERVGINSDRLVAVVSAGGLDFDFDPVRWDVAQDLFFILPDDYPLAANRVGIDTLDMSFVDLVASVDVVVGKPGYGTVSETAVAGTPFVYVPRNNWPEESALVQWLQKHVPVQSIPRDALVHGQFGQAVRELAKQPISKIAGNSGATDFVDAISVMRGR